MTGTSRFLGRRGTREFLRGARILVVDDNPAILALLTEQLEPLGAVVTRSVDGFNATWCVEHFHYDLVLLDLLMPRGLGLDALEFLAGCVNPPPVVVVSGFDDLLEKADLGRYPFVRAALRKPWTEAQLLDAVRDALD
ncbi:MAG: response regulator [Planctomycetes bacterium]|nr:response regulator [Planctomycetota bacterium]